MSAIENSVYKALVLEDDEAQRELSKDMLEMKTGIEVETASSVDEFNYDLTIVDYSGIDIDEVHEETDNLIVFTGYPEHSVDIPEDAEYIQKGSGYDELAETVENWL